MVGCDGDGYTPASKDLEIRTWYDLDNVRNNLAGNHTLMNDLDSTTLGYAELASPTANGGKGWQPIGTQDNPFIGSFDGQGYEIRDLFINRPDEYYDGLFGVVGEGGVIKNLGVVNATVTGEHCVGCLMGANLGTVSNSYSTGNVTGLDFVGGMVGGNGGNVSDSHFTGSVTSNGDMGMGLVGGLVGYNDGDVSDSYATGNVIGNRQASGGLVGANFGTVSNSYSTGNVIGDDFVGGLLGGNGYLGTVSDSYSTGSVTGNSNVGGLIGWTANTGIVSNSYYNYTEVLINGQNIITIGALFDKDFEEWLANDKFLDINGRLSQESGYYAVNNITDFKELLAFGQNSSLKFRLKNDLDLATEPNFYIPYLAGEFDGDGHQISNLSFDFDFVSAVGLFGHLAPGGKVTQVGVENVNITGSENVGGLVGFIWEGTVSNSYSTGSVTGDKYVGGLVGYQDYGIVSNSYSTVSVTSGGLFIGGLVGFNWHGNVSNSYATGNVTGDKYVSGLVADNSGTVSNSYSTGSVTGTSHVGGLVATNYGTVSNSFWDTQTSGQATSAGGIGMNTTEMQYITTFSGAGWNIITVTLNETNPAYIWNIVNNVTYPFLSWQP